MNNRLINRNVGVVGCIAAAACMLAAGAASGQVVQQRQHVSVVGGGPGQVTTMERHAFPVEGRQVSLERRNGVVTEIKLDGKPVDPARVRFDENTVTILGEDDRPMLTFELPASNMQVIVDPPAPPRGWTDRRLREAAPLPAPQQFLRRVTPDRPEPKVMIGLHMAEPSPSLLGHFGLEPGAAIMVASVHEGLPAQSAGLKAFDLIVAIDGKAPATPALLNEVLAGKEPGAELKLTVLSAGQRAERALRLEAYDAERFAAAAVRPDGAAHINEHGQFRRWGPLAEGFDLNAEFFRDLPAHVRDRLAPMIQNFDIVIPAPPGEDGQREPNRLLLREVPRMLEGLQMPEIEFEFGRMREAMERMLRDMERRFDDRIDRLHKDLRPAPADGQQPAVADDTTA